MSDQYEYKLITLPDIKNGNLLLEGLNELGGMGWMLVPNPWKLKNQSTGEVCGLIMRKISNE